MGNGCCGLKDLHSINKYSFGETKPARKMNYSKPAHVSKGISIKRNPKTGLFEGVPKQWTDHKILNLNVDISKTILTSHLSQQIRPTSTIPPNIKKLMQSSSHKRTRTQQFTSSTNIILSNTRCSKY